MQMAALGMEPLASTPEAMTQRFKADADKWGLVIDRAGIPKLAFLNSKQNGAVLEKPPAFTVNTISAPRRRTSWQSLGGNRRRACFIII
jgi:hypothetical protein